MTDQTKITEKPEMQTKNKEHTATAKALNLPISTKQSREIAKFIRNKNTNKAKNLLQQVLEGKLAVPMRRYNRDTGHKPGKIASGRYPKNATKEFIKLINLVEAHAENKGLDTKNLVIYDIRANKGERTMHYGRHRGVKAKRTHIFLGVKEK